MASTCGWWQPDTGDDRVGVAALLRTYRERARPVRADNPAEGLPQVGRRQRGQLMAGGIDRPTVGWVPGPVWLSNRLTSLTAVLSTTTAVDIVGDVDGCHDSLSVC